LAFLSIVLSTGVLVANESVEVSNLPVESKESTPPYAAMGVQHRLTGIRQLSTPSKLALVPYSIVRSGRLAPRSIIGHMLSHELMAPLRC
jgi:hypothetical protein